MKKILLTITLMLGFATVFASSDQISFNSSLIDKIYIQSVNEEEETIESEFGASCGILYQHFFENKLFLEAGCDGNIFLLEGARPLYYNMICYAGTGYKLYSGSDFSILFNIDAGCGLFIYMRETSISAVIKPGACVNFTPEEHLGFRISFDYSFCLSDLEYKDNILKPTFGISLFF